jgi:hypothetical protein
VGEVTESPDGTPEAAPSLRAPDPEDANRDGGRMRRERRNVRVVLFLAVGLAGAGILLMARGVPPSAACIVADGMVLAGLLVGLLGMARLLGLAGPADRPSRDPDLP